MLAAQLIACFFLALSAAFCFGPRLAVYGPRAFKDMAQEGQVQFVGGCLASILVLIFAAPEFGAIFYTGGQSMTVAMIDILTLQYSLV